MLLEKDDITELYTWGTGDDGVLGRIINAENKDIEERTPTKVDLANVISVSGTNFLSFWLILIYFSWKLSHERHHRIWGSAFLGYIQGGGYCFGIFEW